MISSAKRDQVRIRANYYCEYCKFLWDFMDNDGCIEHIVPKSLGGTDDLSNLAFSCFGCNSYKHTFTFAEDP